MQNLHGRFDPYYIGQIYGGDFTKFCCLLRIYGHYCENPARSCENLNFWKTLFLIVLSAYVSLNILERLLDFSQQFKTNGRENSNVYNYLPDLHNRFKFYLFIMTLEMIYVLCSINYSLSHLLYSSTSTVQRLEISRVKNLEISRLWFVSSTLLVNFYRAVSRNF